MSAMDRVTVHGLILWAAVVPASLAAVTLAWRWLRRRRDDRAWAAEIRRRVDDAEARWAEIAWLYALYEAESAEEAS